MDKNNKHVIIGMLLSIVMISAFVGCFWIFLPSDIPENEIETLFNETDVINNNETEEEKMKYLQFETIDWSGATHIKDVLYIKDIINSDNDTVWYVILDGLEYKIYKYIISTNTETLEDTISTNLFPNSDSIGDNGVIKFIDNIIYILCGWFDTGDHRYGIKLRSYTIATDTWATETSITFASDILTGETLQLLDVFSLSDTIYFNIGFRFTGDLENIRFYNIDGTLEDTHAGVGTTKISPGYPNEIDGKYYFIFIDGNTQYLYSFDGTDIANEGTLDISITYNPATLNSIYWEKGSGRVWIYNQQMWYYDITEAIWTDYGRATNQKCCVIWTSDNNISHIIWNGKIYLWEDAGALCLIQQEPSDTYTRDFKKDIEGNDITGVVQWGTSGGPDLSDWVNVGMNTFEVVSTKISNENIMHCIGEDVNDRITYDIGSSESSGTFEMLVVLAQTNKNVYFQLRPDSANDVVRVEFRDDGNIDFVGATSGTDLIAYAINTLYHIKITFIRNGSSTLTINGIPISTITAHDYDLERLYFPIISATAEFWFDAIGFSWDSYVTGSNRHLTETDFICGCLDFFIADQSIYRAFLPSFAVSVTKAPMVETKIYEAPRLSLTGMVKPFDNQYVVLYTEGEVEVIRCFIDDFEEEDLEYKYEMIHGGVYDLDNEIVDSYVALTAPEIIKQDMDNECAFLKYGKGTNEDIDEFEDGLPNWVISGEDANETAQWLSEKILSGVKISDVLEIWDNDGASFLSATRSDFSGTVVSFWAATSNVPDTFYWYIREGATIITTIYIRLSKIQYNDGVIKDLLDPAVNNTWYHIALVFSAAGDTMDIYLNGVKTITGATLQNNLTTAIDTMQIASNNAGTGYQYTSKPYVRDSLYDAMSSFNSISPIPTTVYTFKSKRKTILDRQIWADANEGLVSSIRPNGLVYYDFFSQGVTITERFDGTPKLTYKPIKKSKVVIYGGYLNGVPLKGVAYGEPNFGTYYDEYPELLTKAEVDAMATQILADKNKKIGRFNCTTWGLGNVYAGTKVILTSIKNGISAETWYVIQSQWNPITDKCRLWLTDAYWVPPKNMSTSEDRSNNAIKQSHGQLEERVTFTWRTLLESSPDYDETDLTDDTNWNDLDISSIVGAKKRLILIHLHGVDNATGSCIDPRENGSTSTFGRGPCTAIANQPAHKDVLLETDSAGIIEFKVDPAPSSWTSIHIYIVAYRDA